MLCCKSISLILKSNDIVVYTLSVQFGTFNEYVVNCLIILSTHYASVLCLWSVYPGLDCIASDDLLRRYKYEWIYFSIYKTILYPKPPPRTSNHLRQLEKWPWSFFSFNLSCHLCCFFAAVTASRFLDSILWSSLRAAVYTFSLILINSNLRML